MFVFHLGPLKILLLSYQVPSLNSHYDWLFSDAWQFSFSAFTTWADSDYHETYCGVDANDAARSGLDVYDPDDGIKDVGLNVGANWRFAESWDLRGLLQIKQLVGDADDDSPVVDEGSETQLFSAVLVVLKF
jgi:outer membrane scaffolding protein for murein synthesis (MipA/OmpV family)